MKVQLLQFHVEYGNVEKNETKISNLFSKLVGSDTDVVVLPEMWNNGYALPELEMKADTNLSRSFKFIESLAKKYGVDIIAGSVSNKHEGGLFNTAFTVSKNGVLLNQYDKVHLVPMLNEPEFMDDGDEVPEVFRLSNCTLATQIICYDLRFPELLRYPARSGAEVAFYVAQWPSVRLNHWIALLKARAIENNMFVIGCNGSGNDGNTEYAGNSIIINPNGEVVAQLDKNEGIIAIELNIDEVQQQRNSIPVLENLKIDKYK